MKKGRPVRALDGLFEWPDARELNPTINYVRFLPEPKPNRISRDFVAKAIQTSVSLLERSGRRIAVPRPSSGALT